MLDVSNFGTMMVNNGLADVVNQWFQGLPENTTANTILTVRALNHIKNEKANIISLYLGNGAAIKKVTSIETS